MIREKHRIVGGLDIWFKDKKTIVITDDNFIYTFHRWFRQRPRFYCESWKKFARYLREVKRPKIHLVAEKAWELGISMETKIKSKEENEI